MAGIEREGSRGGRPGEDTTRDTPSSVPVPENAAAASDEPPSPPPPDTGTETTGFHRVADMHDKFHTPPSSDIDRKSMTGGQYQKVAHDEGDAGAPAPEEGGGIDEGSRVMTQSGIM